MKICQFCANEIQDAAVKCQYCGEMLEIYQERPNVKIKKRSNKWLIFTAFPWTIVAICVIIINRFNADQELKPYIAIIGFGLVGILIIPLIVPAWRIARSITSAMTPDVIYVQSGMQLLSYKIFMRYTFPLMITGIILCGAGYVLCGLAYACGLVPEPAKSLQQSDQTKKPPAELMVPEKDIPQSAQEVEPSKPYIDSSSTAAASEAEVVPMPEQVQTPPSWRPDPLTPSDSMQADR